MNHAGATLPPASRLAIAVALAASVIAVACATGDRPVAPSLSVPPSPSPEATPRPAPSVLPATAPPAPTAAGRATIPPVPAATPAAPTATPSPAPTALPTAAPSPLEAELDRIGTRAARQRGFTAVPDPEWSLIDADELAALIRDELDQPDALEDIANEQALYRLLGLVGQDDDLWDQYFRLYSTGVVGLYDPDTRRLYVLSTTTDPADLTVQDERVYVHEYIHFLQDGLFDLNAMEEAASASSDRTLAFLALVEGDARYSEGLYAEAPVGGPRPVAAPDPGPAPAWPPPPYVLRRGLEFPYAEGKRFVLALSREGGLQGVDEAYAAPPMTTEQVLHPEKYMAGEVGRDLTLPDAQSALGPGWVVQDRNSLGEFGVEVWIDALGGGRADAARAAAGWDGDRHLLLSGPAGQHAVMGVIGWDTPRDTGEFYTELIGALDRSSLFRPASCGDAGPADCPQPQGGSTWQGPGGTLALARDAEGRLAAFAVAPSREGAVALADAAMTTGAAGHTSP